jgi:hypothetical protein
MTIEKSKTRHAHTKNPKKQQKKKQTTMPCDTLMAGDMYPILL